jgi:hypothetical protein
MPAGNQAPWISKCLQELHLQVSFYYSLQPSDKPNHEPEISEVWFAGGIDSYDALSFQ